MFKYQTIESLVGPTKKKIDWKLLRTNRLCQCISITKRNSIYRNEFNQRFGITIAFLATHSGLIRWMNFQKPINNYVADSQPQYVVFHTLSTFLISNFGFNEFIPLSIDYCREPTVSIVRSVDEVWYKRAVEQHTVENESFVYSVPFNEGSLNNHFTLYYLSQFNAINVSNINKWCQSNLQAIQWWMRVIC